MRSTLGVSVCSFEDNSASTRVLVATSSKEATAAALNASRGLWDRRTPTGPGSARVGAAAVIAHPQSHKVALAVGLGVIDKRGAAVSQGPIVDKLQLSRL